MKEVAGHGEFTFLPSRHNRDAGLVALTRPDGSEIRLHRVAAGKWEAVDWRQASTSTGFPRWVGPVAGPMTREEWLACAAVMVAQSEKDGESS